ncbi:hypothetical protein [Allorhodopirellula heiligendammensis]|nr:hypothetical protein [Allorhodopirellula heiligendammensis]
MIRFVNGGFVWAVLAVLVTPPSVQAGSPWYVPWEGPWPWSQFEGSRRIDVIGPLGNRLPESYRRKYNRPTYIGGKIAAKIAPSSQEAMSFHRSQELGLYDNNGIKGALSGQHCPPQRIEQHYFYPKPWEVLTVGPRRDRTAPIEDNREIEPRGFRQLLEQSNAFDDAIELAAPVGEVEPPLDELEPLLDELELPADEPEL